MIAERIRIKPFKMERIIRCDIMKQVNEHGRAFVKGYVPAEGEGDCLSLASQDVPVSIEAVSEEGTGAVIFSGIIEDCRIRNSGQVLVMELTLVSHTRRMDLNPAIRSFQTPSMPYQGIFDAITGMYRAGGCIMSEGGEAVTEDLIVQYQETDWEFCKRIASHWNAVMVPSFKTEGPKCYAGLPEWPGTTKVNPSAYESCKLVHDYLYKKQNKVGGIIEDDELCYRIKEAEVLELGERVEFRGKTYHVAEAESHLDGHQLQNEYLIKTKAGFKVPRLHNEKIVGASLDGIVTDVRGAEVKASLGPDAGGGDGKWYPFSTVYSSPDGSGWYCMPEIGDEIRLYFPTVKEKHAYVISSVHLPVDQPAATGAQSFGVQSMGAPSARAQSTAVQSAGAGGCRCDPNKKTIITESGKMVRLDETSILLSNNKGMSILLDDKKGIVINSDKAVTITSESNVDIVSFEGIELTGTGSVTLRQGSGTVSVSDSMVKFTGAEARIQ